MPDGSLPNCNGLVGCWEDPFFYVAFVGSHRKAAALRTELAAQGIDAERLRALRAPAGLDLGAVTPEEIALSILAEIVEVRRRGQHIVPAETGA